MRNVNYLLIYNILIVALPGALYLMWNNVTAGIIYASVFFAVSGAMPIINSLLKKEKNVEFAKKFVSIIYWGKPAFTSFIYLVGLAVPLTMFLWKKFSETGYDFSSLSIPLFGQQIVGAQSFSAAQIESSLPWVIFNTVFTAGNMEHYGYSYGAIIFGFVAGIYLFHRLSDGQKVFGFISKKVWLVLCGLAFSLLTFVLSHLLNGTYTAQNFLIASVFILITNTSIVLVRQLFFFWLGYHQSNNLVWLIGKYGGSTVADGFVSWFGLIFAANILLIVYFVIRNFDQVWADLKALLSSLFSRM